MSQKIHSDDVDAIQNQHDSFVNQFDINDEAMHLQDKAYHLGLSRGQQDLEVKVKEAIRQSYLIALKDLESFGSTVPEYHIQNRMPQIFGEIMNNK